MYRIEIKTTEAHLSANEEDFFKALAWARSMANYDGNGQVKSAEVYEEDRLVASLKTFK
jgi:hypothetical protein